MNRKKRVLVFGTFDLLHRGHLFYLEQARKKGKELIVIVARNNTVKKVKGNLPVMDEKDRLHLIKSLKVVDKAILGCKGNMYKIIKELKPDTICLGYDQKPGVEKLKKELLKLGLKPKIYKIKCFKPHKLKSRKIKEKIRNSK
ncbi:MAG: adenylyltransferase/cytidyltransferase family protein [archaeon]